MSKEEKIRSTINEIDTEILKDTLAILLSKNNTVQNIILLRNHKIIGKMLSELFCVTDTKHYLKL